jgi:hypothetical protein
MTMPGKRPATKLLPENSFASLLAVSVMSMSWKVLGDVDAVASGEDSEMMSPVVVALMELVDDTELVGVVVVDELVATA